MTLDEPDSPPSWGPRYRRIWYAEAKTATDSIKGTLFMRILPAILYEKLGLPIDVATRLVQKHLAGSLVQEINHVVPTHEHKDKIIEILKDAAEKENIKLSDKETEKIAELATEIGEMLHEGLPNTDDVHVRMFAAFKEKRTWEIGRILLENFPELKEAIEKHSDRITQLADELAELRKKREAIEEARRSGATVAVIEKKEPSKVEETFKTLKRIGVDLKLETGNVAERKAKIYAWLVQNGLIRVEEENGKPVVRATEKLNRIVGKYGRATAAMIKWAAEEGVGIEHVEPVAKILGALEEFRQVAKREDPALARALEKAMKSKHIARELLHVSVGLISVEELSERWKDEFGLSLIELLRKSPELTRAFIESMENLSELASYEVPVEWVPLLKMLDGKTPKEELERALERATLLRIVFSAYESLAIRGLPENGKDVTRRMMDILERAKVMVPSADITDELRAELQVLSKVTALMKDETYIEAIERDVTQILAKIPETRKVGLFKCESPRRKVEDFAAVLMEGNLSEEEAEEKGQELERYLRDYLDENEAKELVNNIMIPFRARLLLKRYGTVEDFLFDYAHSKASRLLLLGARLAETLHGREIPHDSLLRTMAGAPSLLGRKRVTLRSFERSRETLKRLLG